MLTDKDNTVWVSVNVDRSQRELKISSFRQQEADGRILGLSNLPNNKPSDKQTPYSFWINKPLE